MTSTESTLLSAIRTIAAGRRRGKSGFLQRISRDEMIEIARRALQAAGETMGR